MSDMPLTPNEYRCAMCHQIYEKGWSDGEAQQETQQYWPDMSPEESEIVCDDCWQKVRPENNPMEYIASLSPGEPANSLTWEPLIDETLFAEMMIVEAKEIAEVHRISPFLLGPISDSNKGLA